MVEMEIYCWDNLDKRGSDNIQMFVYIEFWNERIDVCLFY